MAIIYLIGARGCGKTSVGRLLASQLGCGFTDLDAYLCQKAGKSIAEIVSRQGWDAFRDLESRILAEATAERVNSGMEIMATGGGLPVKTANKTYLRQHGLVIWLKTDANILERRLALAPAEEQRPSLTGKGLLEEIRQVLREREPLYEQCAHHIINGGNDIEKVCQDILAIIDAGVEI